MTPVGLLDEYAGLYAAQSPEPPQKGGDALYEQVLEFSHRLQLNPQGVSVFPGEQHLPREEPVRERVKVFKTAAVAVAAFFLSLPIPGLLLLAAPRLLDLAVGSSAPSCFAPV